MSKKTADAIIEVAFNNLSNYRVFFSHTSFIRNSNNLHIFTTMTHALQYSMKLKTDKGFTF